MVKGQQRSKMSGSVNQSTAREAREGMETSLPPEDGEFGQERTRGLRMGV